MEGEAFYRTISDSQTRHGENKGLPITMEIVFAASFCAGISVFCAVMVLVDFGAYVTSRYQERYVQQAAVELDEVLLQIPPSKIFEMSLSCSALAAFIAVAALGFGSSSFSWNKAFFVAVLTAVCFFPAPRFYLRFLRKRRLLRFNEQLEDALMTMSNALKAGFSINQAVEAVADENRKPISIEFRMLMQEVQLGVPIEEALKKMQKRMESEDFELVATAIITARQTGGELTAVFGRLAAMIRERVRINGKLRALTAQGKLQATVISVMPLLLMFIMFKIAPDMMGKFFDSLLGIGLIALVVVLEIIGFLVIKKITTIDV